MTKDSIINEELEEKSRQIEKSREELRAHLDLLRTTVSGFDEELKKREDGLAQMLDLAQKQTESNNAFRKKMQETTTELDKLNSFFALPNSTCIKV